MIFFGPKYKTEGDVICFLNFERSRRFYNIEMRKDNIVKNKVNIQE